MRKHFLFPVFCLSALVSGCQKDTASTSAISESRLTKPAVAVVPLIDNSQSSLDWNVSEEITYTLCNSLDHKKIFDLALPSRIRAQTKRMKGKNNPFGNDINWVKEVFAEEDFVVFLELIEHSETPKGEMKAASMLPAELKLAVRMRIVDNRGSLPKVTLQEILEDSHFIPKQFNKYNFTQCSWDSEEFGLSPTGMAHTQMIKELKDRIEAYILIAKDRK